MRRFLLLFLSLVLLGASYAVNRLVINLHYIVPVEPRKLAYVAAFDGNQEDWSLSEGQLRSRILETGVLQLEVLEPNRLPFAQSKPYFADFDLRVQASPVGGPLDNGYGIIFRLQNKDNSVLSDDDFYLFQISSDGYYRVLRAFQGEQKELSTWIPSPLILQGNHVVNQLRVIGQGTSFKFFINNQPVQLCIPDDPSARSTYTRAGVCEGGSMQDILVDASIPNGQLALAAQSFDEAGVVIEFDNLVIYGPSTQE